MARLFSRPVAGFYIPHVEPLRAVAGVVIRVIDIATARLMAGVWTYTAIDGSFGDYPLRQQNCMLNVQQDRWRRDKRMNTVLLSIPVPYEEYLPATAALTRA